MKTNYENKLCFTVIPVSRGQRTIELNLRVWLNGYPDEIHAYNSYTINWSATRAAPVDWGGGVMSLATNDVETLQKTARFLKRVVGGNQIGAPAAVLANLRKIGAVFCAYDPRLGEHVEYKNLWPAEYIAYRDDHQAAGNQYFYVTVLSKPDDDAARRAVEVAFLEEVNRRPYSDRIEAFTRWESAGKPVIRGKAQNWQSKGVPDYRTAEQILSDLEAA